MNKEYFLNNNENDITIEVNVSTRGVVFTEVSKKLSDTNFIVIARSTEPPNANGKGKISQRSIGQSNLLGNTELEIFTLIRLDSIPSDQWPAIFENLIITYTLRGGANGGQEFHLDHSDKEKTASGKTIQAITIIKLTLVN